MGREEASQLGLGGKAGGPSGPTWLGRDKKGGKENALRAEVLRRWAGWKRGGRWLGQSKEREEES